MRNAHGAVYSNRTSPFSSALRESRLLGGLHPNPPPVVKISYAKRVILDANPASLYFLSVGRTFLLFVRRHSSCTLFTSSSRKFYTAEGDFAR